MLTYCHANRREVIQIPGTNTQELGLRPSWPASASLPANGRDGLIGGPDCCLEIAPFVAALVLHGSRTAGNHCSDAPLLSACACSSSLASPTIVSPFSGIQVPGCGLAAPDRGRLTKQVHVPQAEDLVSPIDRRDPRTASQCSMSHFRLACRRLKQLSLELVGRALPTVS